MSHYNLLADTAETEAAKFYHGYVMKTDSNLDAIVCCFPGWTKEEADGVWCAAFVYYCCKQAGFNIPIKPSGCSYNLAGCGAWEDWAKADERIAYHSGKDKTFNPERGDIVLFDRIFDDKEHDHIGIVVGVEPDSITVAEGNINNVSGIIKRKKDEYIRSYIRIPNGFAYCVE
jgi:hypothetical protein